jgi:hypothetical protein
MIGNERLDVLLQSIAIVIDLALFNRVPTEAGILLLAATADSAA